ncbi:MAG TPA: serine/threonine-protein kinase [Myxococcota bacterium]|nr:serine/threonine-protein kinase [Myxococcota bacterium]
MPFGYDRMGQTFGDYRLVRRIAAGGMGEVYLAMLEREGGFAKAVALKMMLPTCASRPGFAELFESEAAVAAMLNQANIVQIFDHGCIEGRPFLTMELVEGPDLAALIAGCQARPLPAALVTEIGVQLCRALSHAHGRRDLGGRPLGIVHGDISPPNILLTLDGWVKLADFGLARLLENTSGDGLLTGKYSYMSPEQARAATLEPRSDLFSLGLVLYELACGRRAYPLLDPPDLTLEAISRGDYAAPGGLCPELPPALSRVIERALMTAPAARFESAAAMSGALQAAVLPCGPEELALFIRRNIPKCAAGAYATPEPTELADKPLASDEQTRQGLKGRGWIIGLAVLFVLGWGAGFGLWIFHQAPPGKPEPPVSRLPAAPRGLAVSPAPAPVIEKQKTPVAKRADPGPGLRVTCSEGFAVTLDNRPLLGKRLSLGGPRPHLVRLKSLGAARAEILARFDPPGEGRNGWRVSLRSNPWMNIRLDGRPAGQTPRSRLPVEWGRSSLVLVRDDIRVELAIEARSK